MFVVTVGAAVAVAVFVTVLVAVFVAIAAAAVGAVEQDGHVAVALGGVVLVDLGEHHALQQAGTDDEHRGVGEAVDEVGVRDDLHRRAVEEDVVVGGAQPRERLLEARVGEQLRRVGRDRTDREDVQAGLVDVLDDQGLVVVDAAVEVVAQAPLGLAGELAQGLLAEVQVHGQGAPSLDGEGRGQVGGAEGLAAARVHRGEHHHVGAFVLAALHELEVGADHAEGFVDDVAAAVLDHDLALFGVLRRVVERGEQVLQEGLLGLIGCGELAEERDRHPVQVLRQMRCEQNRMLAIHDKLF